MAQNSNDMNVFVGEVTAALVSGHRHQTPGFGTFSTCARKATPERAACRMGMFRASAELRAFADGAQPPQVSGPHADVVNGIIQAMNGKDGVDVPGLGRFAVVPVPGKKPKLIFHGADKLNSVL